MPAAFITVFFQVFHKRRAARPDIRRVTLGRARLLVNIAGRIFQVPRTEGLNMFNTVIIKLYQLVITLVLHI